MMEEAKNIDDLFAIARVEEPRVSSEAVLNKLQNSLSPSKGGSINNISTFKLIIMIGTISTIALTALIFTTTPDGSPMDLHVTQNIKTHEEKYIDAMDDLSSQPLISEIETEEQPKEIVHYDGIAEEIKSDMSKASRERTDFIPVETPSFEGEKHMNSEIYIPISKFEVGGDLDESRIFLIDQNTSIDQLEIIKIEAEKAGISFEYKTRSNGSMKKLHMMIKTETSTSSHKLVIDKEFKTQIGWIVDKENNTVRFYDRQNEIEIAMEELKINVDSIKIEVINFEQKVIKESGEKMKR